MPGRTSSWQQVAQAGAASVSSMPKSADFYVDDNAMLRDVLMHWGW